MIHWHGTVWFESDGYHGVLHMEEAHKTASEARLSAGAFVQALSEANHADAEFCVAECYPPVEDSRDALRPMTAEEEADHKRWLAEGHGRDLDLALRALGAIADESPGLSEYERVIMGEYLSNARRKVAQGRPDGVAPCLRLFLDWSEGDPKLRGDTLYHTLARAAMEALEARWDGSAKGGGDDAD